MDEDLKEKPDLLTEIDNAMSRISEAFVSLRSTVGKLHYGEKVDIKAAASVLLQAELDFLELIE